MDAVKKVEHRLFQLVVNAYGDERRTALLLHWDGAVLRVAWNGGTVPESFGGAQAPMQSMLRQMVHRAQSYAPPSLRPSGLDDAYPVREGEGTNFVWMPKRIGYTRDTVRHFEELAKNLGLEIVAGLPAASQRPSRSVARSA